MDTLDQIDPRLLLLKRGTRLLAKACGGNEAAGQIVSRSGETVRRWGDPDFPDSVPLHAVLLLEAECGKPVLTRILAEQSGHALAPVTAEPASASLASAHADAMLASAALTREVVEAKRDGVITPNENAAISRAGLEAQDAIGRLLKAATPGSAAPAGPEAGTVRYLKPGERA